MGWKSAIICFALIAQVAAGCAGIRRNLGQQLVPLETELALGEQVAAEVEGKEKILRNPTIQNYVRQIAAPLVEASKADRPEITYSIKVIDNDKMVNAFAVPGGHLYVYTGLILAADNEAEIAGVMAHEIGHIVGRHSANQLAAQHGLQLLTGIALGEDPAALGQIAAQIASAGAMSSFSRDDEREADKYGVKYTIATGYDPRGLLTFFQKLKAQEGGQKRSELELLLSTHPATEERIADIEKRIAKAGNPSGKDNRARFRRMQALLKR